MYLRHHWWLRFHCCFAYLTGCYAIDPGCNVFPEPRVIDHRYDSDLLESLSPVGYQQCRTRCRARHVCLGINYNREQLLCELVSIATSVSEPLTFVPGYSFTDLNATDVIPPQEICQKDSCPEGHMCIILKSTGNLTCVEDYNAVATTTTTMLPTTTTTTPTTTTPTTTTTTPTTTTTTPTTTTTTPTTTTTTPTTTTTTTISGNGCVSGDFTFEASVDLCYRLVTNSYNWWASGYYCAQYTNGRLMILDSATKIQFIHNLISSSTYLAYPKWWIDGSKPDDDSQFTWGTGTAVSPQPTSEGEDRLKMVIKVNGVFYDEEPEIFLPYICEEHAG